MCGVPTQSMEAIVWLPVSMNFSFFLILRAGGPQGHQITASGCSKFNLFISTPKPSQLCPYAALHHPAVGTYRR